jgi:hypothetical protein
MHFGTVSDWDISASGVLPIMIQTTKKKRMNETTLSDTSKKAGVRQYYLSALRAPRTPHRGSISVGHFPRHLNVPIITNKKQYLNFNKLYQVDVELHHKNNNFP